MWFKTRYDEQEIECQFCHKTAKPIIERNWMDIGFGMTPGPFFGRAGSSSANKPKKFVLICPNCKALIGVNR